MSFLNNLKRDALNTAQGLEPQNLLQAFLHPGRTVGGIADFYGQLARHPVRTFENAPLSTALGFAPGVGPLAKLAKLRMLDAGVLPADAAFADVASVPKTSFDIPSESGFGVSIGDVPVANMLDAIKRGPQFNMPDVSTPEAADALFSAGQPDTALPTAYGSHPMQNPQDVLDTFLHEAHPATWMDPKQVPLDALSSTNPIKTQDFVGSEINQLGPVDPGNVDPTQSYLNKALGAGFDHTLSADTLAGIGPTGFMDTFRSSTNNGNWNTPFHNIMNGSPGSRGSGALRSDTGPPNASYGSLQDMDPAAKLRLLQQLLMRAYGNGMGPGSSLN